MGQKQGEIGGEFIAREAWSGQLIMMVTIALTLVWCPGKLSQFNIWNWPLEDYYLENAAECRSDLMGNMVAWRTEDWTIGPNVMQFIMKDDRR